MSLCLSFPHPFCLSFGRIHPSIHCLSCCSSAKNTDILSHHQVRDTPHPVVPAPVWGQCWSLSIFFLPPHCPSAPSHPRCLHFSKLHPSPRVCSLLTSPNSPIPFLQLLPRPPPPVNTAFARFSFLRICLALRDWTLTLKEAQVWLIVRQPHKASSHVYMLPPQRDRARLSLDPGSRRGMPGPGSYV